MKRSNVWTRPAATLTTLGLLTTMLFAASAARSQESSFAASSPSSDINANRELGELGELGEFGEFGESGKFSEFSEIEAPASVMAVASPTPPATPTPDPMMQACAEAVEELRAARKLLEAQGTQIERQNELIKLERTISERLTQTRELDAAEKAELRNALAAAERQIAAVQAQVDVLKKERPSVWTKLKWIGYGIAAGVVVGTLLK